MKGFTIQTTLSKRAGGIPALFVFPRERSSFVGMENRNCYGRDNKPIDRC